MLTTIFTPSLRLRLEAKECASYKEAIYDRVQQHFKSQKEVASLKTQTCTKISTVITLANNQHNIYGQAKEFCVIIVYICKFCLTNVSPSVQKHTPSNQNMPILFSKEIEQGMRWPTKFS